MTLPPHLQGFGTYTYECHKHDCYHCEKMGLTPQPAEYLEQEEKAFNYRKSTPVQIPVRPHQNPNWTGEEIMILRTHLFKANDEVYKLLPGRTKSAIYTQNCKLRKIRRDFKDTA